MRHSAILFIFALTPPNGTAGASPQSVPLDIPLGTYKTQSASSHQECIQLCRDDSAVCRGSYTIQPDITENLFLCYLYDGMEAGSPFEVLPPEPLDLEVAVSDLNAYRSTYGLNPVTLDAKLILSSKVHADDMAEHGIVSHTGTDGSTHTDRMERTGYAYSIAGENVASGQNSWDKVFKAWQDSPGHNENLLMGEATHFGVALVFEKTTEHRYYWAMIMAAPYSEISYR